VFNDVYSLNAIETSFSVLSAAVNERFVTIPSQRTSAYEDAAIDTLRVKNGPCAAAQIAFEFYIMEIGGAESTSGFRHLIKATNGNCYTMSSGRPTGTKGQ
jgi:hypothetical protein